MIRPKHLKCPCCNEYVFAMVRDTRMEGSGIVRKRLCEKCGIMIITQEEIVDCYVPQKRAKRK